MKTGLFSKILTSANKIIPKTKKYSLKKNDINFLGMISFTSSQLYRLQILSQILEELHFLFQFLRKLNNMG